MWLNPLHRRTSNLVNIPSFRKQTYSTLVFHSLHPEERSLALAYLHASVNKLSESELFDRLPSTFHRPPLAYIPGDGLDNTGSSGRVRGGGQISRPKHITARTFVRLLSYYYICAHLLLSLHTGR